MVQRGGDWAELQPAQQLHPGPSLLYQNHSPPTVFRLNREDMLRDHTYNGAKVGKETYESRLKRGTHYPRSQPVNMHE